MESLWIRDFSLAVGGPPPAELDLPNNCETAKWRMMGRCHFSNDPSSYICSRSWTWKNMCHLEVSEWNHHLQGQIRNLWTTICIWWPNPRKKKLPPDLTCTACARPADGDDLVVGQRLWKISFLFIWPNVQAPHLSFSAEHFYQDLCKYSPTFKGMYKFKLRGHKYLRLGEGGRALKMSSTS